MTLAQMHQAEEDRDVTVERYAKADVPTEYGTFEIVVYREKATGAEHVAIVKGDVQDGEGVHVRVHSECLTGEVLHSLKCDCREQLDYALRHIAEEDVGVVLYLRQEGRGIGLGNKIRAYALQQQGIDTVDANRMLGFEDDLRRYHVATDMLADLGVRSVTLLTNNPAKVDALREDGVEVSGRLPVHIPPNEHNRDYLLTKRARMGHMLSHLSDLLLDAE
jgi:GTP cyclohydrolase II/3,4-dihydroxy 2-butanone 4-phosphate synthase/GTP cyclohydrolase II